MSVARFTVLVLFFIIAGWGLYTGIDQWSSEPSLAWALPLRDKVIVIDAGHGGIDPGAVSDSGILEKEITLPVAKRLRDYLQQAGARVIMLREDDRDLAREETRGYSRRKNEDLKERARIVREANASLLLSVHCNAVESSRWSGAQTLYNGTRPESKKLAASIQDSMREQLGVSRSIVERNDLYLLRYARTPGAMVELGFLSHPEEAEKLAQARYQELLVLSIYKGVLGYYADMERAY